ncbi:flagellar hook assembly protein FlgD [Rhizobacter sp. OV335]|jgi:flagellar basal-body rod modification protein FlgD|uniref:flagellar hook assembly protein FlgD n=1 Tax=Rhizobacter sp. OV335 TaxID=1500264 RepID=UPI00091E01A6|nr:flagellar hook capping FlgD N-terminal domain-containing protein [Rhizobacter sp. OV335]SHN34837.1 flagellar basal-body rod modification protein FlgD [Rhizobacter sp. OV335]
MAVDTVTNNYAALNTKSSTDTSATTAAESSERFLKLLVAQMQNQDPLNPMDNAQVTSQIAQINTVSGIEKLNGTVGGLSTQFLQMQAVQGASLVGREVIVPGNKMDIADKVGTGGFQIDAAADNVKIEVQNAAGQTLQTLNLGAQSSGMNTFEWDAGAYDNTSGITFKVTAMSGANTLKSTALMRDKVNAISTANNTLVLDLEKAGGVTYDQVKAFN